jgi:hypothetical protein
VLVAREVHSSCYIGCEEHATKDRASKSCCEPAPHPTMCTANAVLEHGTLKHHLIGNLEDKQSQDKATALHALLCRNRMDAPKIDISFVSFANDLHCMGTKVWSSCLCEREHSASKGIPSLKHIFPPFIYCTL